MKPTFLISILFFGYYIRTSCALPIPCSNYNSPENYVRLLILERIYSNVQHLTESLKVKTGALISAERKQQFDAALHVTGFPNISSSANCSVCNQTQCFEEDRKPLENLMRFINRYMSSSYSTEIVSITAELSVIRGLMGGDVLNLLDIFQIKDFKQSKDTDYLIAKDTVEFINKVKKRYETRV